MIYCCLIQTIGSSVIYKHECNELGEEELLAIIMSLVTEDYSICHNRNECWVRLFFIENPINPKEDAIMPEIVIPTSLNRCGELKKHFIEFNETPSTFMKTLKIFPINGDNVELILYGDIPWWVRAHIGGAALYYPLDIDGGRTPFGWIYKPKLEELSSNQDFLHKLYIQTWDMDITQCDDVTLGKIE